MPSWMYLPACLLVPAAWGFAMFHGFEYLRRWRRAPQLSLAPRTDLPPADYTI